MADSRSLGRKSNSTAARREVVPELATFGWGGWPGSVAVMKTFRESLVWIAFDDAFPPFLSTEERADYWQRNPHAELSRARDLGVVYRAGRWTTADAFEFNVLADQPDSFARYQDHSVQRTAFSRMFA